MTPRFAQELFADTAEEAQPLIQAHAKEVGLLDGPLEFRVDAAGYMALEAVGVLKWYTMRAEQGGALEGYAMWFLTPALVFGGQIVGANEAVYVRPAQRYYAAGFMAFCEAEMRRAGAVLLTYTMWEDRQAAKLLERRGFKPKQVTYWLDNEEPRSCA